MVVVEFWSVFWPYWWAVIAAVFSLSLAALLVQVMALLKEAMW